MNTLATLAVASLLVGMETLASAKSACDSSTVLLLGWLLQPIRPIETLPDLQRTPGVIDPAITQLNIEQTICRRGGYTASVRPSVSYTEELKRQGIRDYGYTDRRLRDYEEDHLVPLELGGSAADPRNLWPQPHLGPRDWGSYAKDRLENALHGLVCSHRLPLADAQWLIAHDWIAAYQRYVGAEPDNTPLP